MKKLEAGGDRHLYTLKGLSVYISSIILLFFLFLEGNSTVENNFNNAIWNSQKTNSTLQTKNETMVDVSELHPYEENTNQENDMKCFESSVLFPLKCVGRAVCSGLKRRNRYAENN